MANMTDIIGVVEAEGYKTITEVKKRIKENNSDDKNYEIGIEFEGIMQEGTHYLAFRTTSKWNLANSNLIELFSGIEIKKGFETKIFIGCEQEEYEAVNSIVLELEEGGKQVIDFDFIKDFSNEEDMLEYADVTLHEEIKEALGKGSKVYAALWKSEGGFGCLKMSRSKKEAINKIIEDVKEHDKKYDEKQIETMLLKNIPYEGERCEYLIEQQYYWEL